MTNDPNEDILEFFERKSQQLYGHSLKREQLLEEFSTKSPEYRSVIFDAVDKSLGLMAEGGNLREQSRLFSLRRSLQDRHDLLRRLGK